MVEGGGRGVLGRGKWGREALSRDACAFAGHRDLLVAQLAAPPAQHQQHGYITLAPAPPGHEEFAHTEGTVSRGSRVMRSSLLRTF